MMGWGGRRCLREGGSYSQFHMRWSWCYYKWELIRKRDLNQGNSIHTTSRREKSVCVGGGWVGFKHDFVDGAVRYYL